MASYGYSLWIVPVEQKAIRARYNMKHIPHVTIKTNLASPSWSAAIGQTVLIDFSDAFVKIPPQYSETEPLTASGFYCRVRGLKYETIAHAPHMTVWYGWDGDHGVFREGPGKGVPGVVMRADTRACDPSLWSV